MARGGPNYARRQDLARALKRAKPDDLLKLEELAKIWGTVKTRFVNVKGEIDALIGFPVPVTGDNNTHLYPAREALEAMQKYETRNDQVEAERGKRIARIMGRGPQGKGRSSQPFTLSLSDMAQASRLAAEIEEREREQGLFVPVSDVAATAAGIFDIFSEYLDDLDNRIDPNGLLTPDTRAFIRTQGAELLLKVHGEMRDMLAGNAGAQSPGSPRLRRSARRSR